MKKSSAKISIVVPAHNEEKRIEGTVTELSDNFRSAEIIVVCNGCADRTYEVARKIKRPNIRAVNFYEPMGKGGAVFEGFKIATGDVVGFVDADGSFKVEDIRKIIDLTENYDAVIASKWKGRRFFDVQSGFLRKIGSRGWNFMANMVADTDFDDTQAGLKFFRREVIDDILKSELVCRGFDFDVELLYRTKRSGFGVKEVYVSIRDGGRSTFDMRSSPKMFANLMKLHLSKDKQQH